MALDPYFKNFAPKMPVSSKSIGKMLQFFWIQSPIAQLCTFWNLLGEKQHKSCFQTNFFTQEFHELWCVQQTGLPQALNNFLPN